MATYELGPAVEGVRFRRPVRCQCCSSLVGTAVAPSSRSGLTGNQVMQLWPRLADMVRDHEAHCPARDASDEDVLVLMAVQAQ